MAKQTLNGTRTSLYRLTRVSDLKAGIQEKYLSDTNFSVQELLVENRKSLLIVGATARKRVSWGPALSSLTGETIELENTTAAGVLIIPSAEGSSVHDAAAGGPVEKDQEVAWALTYGMGFQLLNQAMGTVCCEGVIVKFHPLMVWVGSVPRLVRRMALQAGTWALSPRYW